MPPLPDLIAPTAHDVVEAAHKLKGIAHRTPVLRSRTADERSGAQLFFKSEHLQRMGAFKFRGGYNAVSVLGDAQRGLGALGHAARFKGVEKELGARTPARRPRHVLLHLQPGSLDRVLGPLLFELRVHGEFGGGLVALARVFFEGFGDD